MGVVATFDKAHQGNAFSDCKLLILVGAIKCIAWSPDGKALVTGSTVVDDCSLGVHSLTDQKTLWVKPHLHHGYNKHLLPFVLIKFATIADINTVDWSTDGKLIITGSDDNSVKIIDVKAQVVLHHFVEIHAG